MRLSIHLVGLVVGWGGLAATAAHGAPASLRGVKGFVVHGGDWTVRDGVLGVAGGAGPKLVAADGGFADGGAGVEVFFADRRAGNAGLILHVREAGVGADAFVGYEIALDPSRGMLRLGKHKHDFTLLRDAKANVPVGRWIRLAARIEGRRIEVDVDGVKMLRFEDAEDPLPAGAVGLRPWQRPARFRNLWVRAAGRKRSLPFVQTVLADPLEDPKLPVASLPPIALITRHPLSRPNAIACDIWQSRPRRGGCSIRVLDPARPGEPARTIFQDDDGCIYDMNVSYDARTLYFSFRDGGEAHWHIWRIGTDGTGRTQLTRGPYYDISPLLLPDGDILFVSTRRGGYTVCQPGPASNLHRMRPDGSDIRCVSMNTLSDFSPQMLPDGRVLFTRWEYVDRDLTYRQSLWTQNPDGTAYQLFFGNTVREVATFWQARPLPGSSGRVVATFAPHHGWPHGAIGLIDRRYGVEGPRGRGYTWITKDIGPVGDRAREWSYRDPFPVTDTTFLVSYGGGANRYRVFLLGADGRRRLVYEDPAVGCYNALPLRPVPVPPRVAEPARPGEQPWGAFYLQDACRGLDGVDRARVTALRIMEQVRKSEDLVGRAYDQSPVMSYGTYYAKRCWGTVELAADKSAYFEAPALREIYFQLLDADGREVHRMTSAAQIMPGQTLGCIGCHEPRDTAPPAGRDMLALRGGPVRPRRPEYLADGIVDFPSVVQPVLDRHCVRCHTGPDPGGGMMLTGDKTRLFNMAYDNLLGRSRSYRQHDMSGGWMLPAERARPRPLVHFFWLLRTPTGVNQPLWTGSHASRLLQYVETDHPRAAVPLADRRRIYLWIDADVPYYGTYAHSRPKSPGRRDLCSDPVTGQDAAWFARGFLGVYKRRCAACHGPFPQPNDHGRIWDGKLAWINFSRPHMSSALRAHRAKPHGRDIRRQLDGRFSPAGWGPSDPDYRTMRESIEVGRACMIARPRADMPGFKGGRKEP